MDIGLIYVIFAELLWASEIIFIKKFFPNVNSVFLSAIGSIMGTLFYLPTFFVVREKISIGNWLIVLIYGFVCWFLAQIFYVNGIQKAQSSFGVSLAVLFLPIGTLVMSLFFLKETISTKSIIGSIFMVIGFLLVAMK